MPPDKQSHQQAWIIARPSRLNRPRAPEPKLHKVQPTQKCRQHPHWICLLDIFLYRTRQQHTLSPFSTFDISHRRSLSCPFPYLNKRRHSTICSEKIGWHSSLDISLQLPPDPRSH